MITKEELEFLRESNNIESEYDDKSLEDAILAWEYCKKQKKLTTKVILETHRILMGTRTTLEAADKGHFRDGPVWVGGREGRPFYSIPALIEHWIEDVNTQILSEGNDIPKEDHIRYEHLHPFFDGNGRTGRIFYNWQRTRLGLPIHVIHTGKEQYEYYEWFK